MSQLIQQVIVDYVILIVALLRLTYPIPSLGDVYIADHLNHRIRKVTVSTGIITTIAGTGSTTFSGDNGPATSAGLYAPYSVELDAAGSLLSNSLFPSRINFLLHYSLPRQRIHLRFW